ncbi:tetratricopeptide repeat protein [Yoonia sp. 208BN28-4]|uniref:tetratricopeptide repeat protein n=1 Tax=Yoonia sp. 208BN28-4 TaxID=3126505 RepID=UPI0030B2741A
MRTSFSVAALCAALLLPSDVISQARDVPTDGPFVAAYDAAQPAREAYFSGDYAQVVALATPLADTGNAVAQNLLATLFTDAAYAGFDFDKGMQLYQAAADQGYAKAFHNIGLTHLNDLPGYPADDVAAAAAFRAGADLGYLSSYAQLINLRLFGGDAVQDAADGQALIAQALALDPTNPEILFQAGEAAYTGTGEPEDNAKALAFYRQAADQDHPEANYAAGYMLTYGLGTDMDDTAADAYFSRAAELGHVAAHGYLAQSLVFGYGGPADPVRGLEVAENGAALGDGLSFEVLGDIYEYGEAGETDFDKARGYFQQAIDAGHPDGYIRLGDLASFGKGEAEDLAKAYDLYSQGLAAGATYDGALLVGGAKLYGRGTSQDLQAGRALLLDAWAQGNTRALADLVTAHGDPDYAVGDDDDLRAYAFCILAREFQDIDSDPDFFFTAVPVCNRLDTSLSDEKKSAARALSNLL